MDQVPPTGKNRGTSWTIFLVVETIIIGTSLLNLMTGAYLNANEPIFILFLVVGPHLLSLGLAKGAFSEERERPNYCYLLLFIGINIFVFFGNLLILELNDLGKIWGG